MIARIATEMSCDPDTLWNLLVQPASLQTVSAPVLSFIPAGDTDLSRPWVTDTPYTLRLRLLKVIPLGSHTIRLVEADRNARRIVSRETGRLARVWNHTISFEPVRSGKMRYTDEIEIEAGWITWAVWLFAHGFYRHRQRRWKRLLMRQSP